MGIRVGVLFGGQSGEHEVSLASAQSVIRALEVSGKYRVVPIGITPDGLWVRGAGALQRLAREADFLLPGYDRDAPAELSTAEPEPPSAALLCDLDVVFPVLHGPRGEDGTVQGLMELAGVPYVGCGVAASAVSMDKHLMKQLLRAEGLPVIDWVLVRKHDWVKDPDRVLGRIDGLGLPCFVKPANMGSSVGINKVRERAALTPAIHEALRYDVRAVVERAVDAREIECSVLGHHEPRASVPGEIVPSREFYDYEAKYLAEDPSELRIPAPLEPAVSERVRELAVRAFSAVDGSGMARVDFLLDRHSGEPYLNELNTIPGFTTISMYSKLWEASGLPYPQLIDELIRLALERHEERRGLRIRYQPEGKRP